MTLLSTAYLPPVEWFVHLYHSREVSIEGHCSYLKQTYRNRATILSANGVMDLSIPIEKSHQSKPLTRDIRISDHGNWRHLHWTALFSAYNSSPFFEYYQDDFRPFYERRFDFLFDFNQALIQLLLELLELERNISITSAYEPQTNGADLRELIQPKYRLSEQTDLIFPPYYQVFGQRHGFVPNLSVVDLLFNMGNESALVLRNSKVIVCE